MCPMAGRLGLKRWLGQQWVCTPPRAAVLQPIEEPGPISALRVMDQ